MSTKFVITRAKTTKDAVKWVAENPHYEGWWDGNRPGEFKSFNLRGENSMITIPADIYDGDMIECETPFNGARIFRPSKMGLELLQAKRAA